MLNGEEKNPQQEKSTKWGMATVNCQVSDRWIQLAGSVADFDGERIAMNIMERRETGESRKLCTLIIKREEILRALHCIHRGEETEDG